MKYSSQLSVENIPKRVSKNLLGHVWVSHYICILRLPTLFLLVTFAQNHNIQSVRQEVDERRVLPTILWGWGFCVPPPSAQNRTSQQSTTLQNSFNRPKILWQLQKLHQFGTVLDLVDKNSSKKDCALSTCSLCQDFTNVLLFPEWITYWICTFVRCSILT